ncbi:lipopolysaccharide biosynthesis protein [Parablastomonas sp. CN1-191]|uniref:lipopolysaccharide biosynthesis protein n=1 Tax=Parablastomonas sp. CN1-191 TaxID=3400908 RepID=UPI003BF7C212
MNQLWKRAWALVGFGRLQTLSMVTFSQGFVAIAYFVQMAVLARILPIAEFGKLATLLSVANVMEAAVGARAAETALAAFAELRLDDVAGRNALVARLLRIDFAWSSAIYTLLALGVLGYDYMRGTNSHWLLVLMVGSWFAFPWGTLKAYLTIYRGPRVFPAIEMSYAAAIVLIGLGLAVLLGGFGFVLGMVFAAIVRSVQGLRQSQLSLRKLAGETPEDRGVTSRRLWWFGLTGTVRSGLMNFAQQMDVLLLSAAASPTSVALYRAAKTISGVSQRFTTPIWFVLKRHIILGSRADAAEASLKLVLLASLGFAAIGFVAIPLVIWLGDPIMGLAFGQNYRAGSGALAWLLIGAWTLYAVTGWSSLFGSVANTRLTVIGLYVLQIACFGTVALVRGVDHVSLAFALALSQVLVAGCFWVLLARSRRARRAAQAAAG